MSINEPPDENFLEVLEHLGIETSFHEVIVELCGGRLEYAGDIEEGDLKGRRDSNGHAIPAPVSRGLVRKLRSHKQITDDNDTKTALGMNEKDVEICPKGGNAAPCGVGLRRGEGEYSSIIRCSVRGRPGKNTTEPVRRKILTAVLDNSGSMRPHWSLVVDAVTKVFTDELLVDPFVSLKAIAYNTKAEEIKLPRNSSGLSSLLKQRFSPTGITNFKSAFELAEVLVGGEVQKLAGDGVPLDSVDVTTLIFTDGADTSVPPLGYATAAATAKARAAGDEFQCFLRRLGCPAYTCTAAFGEHHNPEQCQYLSDRYYYINRREVLSDWLMGGLSDLLKSSGFFSLHVNLPSYLSLAEPLPKTIGLGPGGNVEYEIWLRDDSVCSAPDASDEVIVTVEENGKATLSGSACLSSATVIESQTLEGRLFLLDTGEMQLRQIALELRGRRPSTTELAMLRERLVGVQALLQPVSDVAGDPKSRVSGRSLLLARVEELEARRCRLSYTLGHFEDEGFGDARKIGAVGIDAVLRDVSQRVPMGSAASKYAQIAATTAKMDRAENLSEYGKAFFFDTLSGCNAKEAADQGDALFFCVSDVSVSSDGSITSSCDCNSQPVAHDVFAMLSKNGTGAFARNSGQNGKQLALPVYATQGHFKRAMLFLPDVLEKVSGKYVRRESERLLLDFLGRSLAERLERAQPSEQKSLELFHKARSVFAVLSATESLVGATSLFHEVLLEAEMFVERIDKRKDTRNLFAIAAVGLLAQDWPRDRLVRLGDAVIEESMRRAIARRIAGESQTARIQLAWALLGNGDEGESWLDCALDGTQTGNFAKEFDITTAGHDLEILEEMSPGKYSPRDPAILSEILGTTPPEGTLKVEEWCALRCLFGGWGSVAGAEKPNGGLWSLLDRMMVDDSAANYEDLSRLESVLGLEHEAKTLRDVLSSPEATLCSFARECLEEFSSFDGKAKEIRKGSIRADLASLLNSLVKKREASARKYPILGSEYPALPRPSEARMKEVWGASASPIDKPLYDKVRQMVHRKQWNRPLTIREALTDKQYRSCGGKFEFPTRLDTFIPGLHRRTRDLHEVWITKHRQTKGPGARKAAVAEMLLRLPWDDSDCCARGKLSEILGSIWDGLNEVPPGDPISSALWIDDCDTGEDEGITEACSVVDDGDGWDVV